MATVTVIAAKSCHILTGISFSICLVSERPDLLLPTILSRTQEVVVPRLTDEEVRAELERRGERDPEKIRTGWLRAT